MWFLAVYLLVTACTPLTMKAWKRLGWISFVIYIPLVLGIVQVELVLALEPLSRRMLDSVRIWTATVLMNGMIVTVYLWHLTAFVLVMTFVRIALGGVGLDSMPGTTEWWLSRPL